MSRAAAKPPLPERKHRLWHKEAWKGDGKAYGKVMEQLVLDAISKQLEEKKVIRTSQHGFTKAKSCSTKLVAFYDGITSWIDGGRAAEVVSLDFSKAFDAVSLDILIRKLRKRGMDEWTVRWVENRAHSTWLLSALQVLILQGDLSGRRTVVGYIDSSRNSVSSGDLCKALLGMDLC